MNYIDTIIILVLLLYAVDGWVRGLRDKLSDLIGFILSFLLALGFYPFLADLLIANLELSRHFAKAVALVVIIIVMTKVISLISDLVARLSNHQNESPPSDLEGPPSKSEGGPVEPGFHIVEEHIEEKKTVWLLKLRQSTAAVVAIFDGVLFATLTLTFTITFPLQPQVKTDIFNSRIGNIFVAQAAGLENKLTTLLGGTPNETLAFVTLPPRTNNLSPITSIPLGISLPETRLVSDPSAETEFLHLVNLRRKNIGIPVFKISKVLKRTRELTIQMLAVGLIYSPSPNYLVALAPSSGIAVEGLLSIPQYREILLESTASEIAIGVIDAGPYGKLFVVNLTETTP